MEHEHKSTGWRDYIPLLVIVAFCFLLGLVHKESFVYGFMGYFLVFLSMFKFFDLHGFVEGFSSYDLGAQKSIYYAYAYPFIELFLGLAYLSQFLPFLINIIMIALMSFSATGVVKSIFSGRKFSCACLGTVIKVPLSTISILENAGMGLMALFMLIRG